MTRAFELAAGTANGYIEHWYVEDIGLVQEIHTNTDDGTVILTRELSGY